MKVDLSLIRHYFDELQIATRIDEDGDLVIVQDADEDFPYDVTIFVTVLDGRLTYNAYAGEYTPPGDLLEVANSHNCRSCIPVAVVRDGILRMTYSFFLDEDVSEDHIKKNCIMFALSSIWQAFVNLEK